MREFALQPMGDFLLVLDLMFEIDLLKRQLIHLSTTATARLSLVA